MFLEHVNRITIISIAVAAALLFGTLSVGATGIIESVQSLELRTKEQLILDQDQQLELTLIVLGAKDTNVIGLRLETTGGVEVADIVPIGHYISLSKQVTPVSARIDMAKTSNFTREDIAGTIILEMTGTSDGSVIITRDSIVGASSIPKSFTLDIRFGGAARIPEKSSNIPIITPLIVSYEQLATRAALKFGVQKELVIVASGIVSVIGLGILLALLKNGDRLRRRAAHKSKYPDLKEEDLNIGGAPELESPVFNPIQTG